MTLFPKYFREERQKRKEEKEEEKRRKDEDRKLAEVKRRRELEEAKEAAKEAAAAKMAAALGLNNNGLIGGPNGHGGLHGANGLGFANGLGSGADCVFDSMQVEFDVDDDLNMADVEDGNDMDDDDLDRIDEDEDDEEEEEDEEDDTTCFGKRFSFESTMPFFLARCLPWDLFCYFLSLRFSKHVQTCPKLSIGDIFKLFNFTCRVRYANWPIATASVPCK